MSISVTISLITALATLAGSFWESGRVAAFLVPLAFVGGPMSAIGAFTAVGTSLDGNFSTVSSEIAPVTVTPGAVETPGTVVHQVVDAPAIPAAK